jgi:uncharacterized paraquat-inducible protein A
MKCPHCNNEVSLFNQELNFASQAVKRCPRCGKPFCLHLRSRGQMLWALGGALTLMVLALALPPFYKHVSLLAGLAVTVIVGIVGLFNFELEVEQPRMRTLE